MDEIDEPEDVFEDGFAGLETGPLVRRATAGDAASIADIHVGTWQAAYRGLIADAVLDALDVPARAAFWQRILEGPHDTFVAEGREGVMGFCSLVPARDVGFGTAEIAALYVAPRHWRQGAGRALCAAVLNCAAESGFAGVSLWVLAENERAISFYRTQGFACDGAARTEEFSEGIPTAEIRMTRSLGA